MLDLRVSILKGPLYRYGEVRITGLAPDLEALARRTWRPKSGDPYDYLYPNEFFQAFSRLLDPGKLPRYQAVVQKGAGDHVVDINLTFKPR